MTFSSTLTIEELPTTGKGRKLVLQGGGLPFMGSEWAGENNLTTTWYPGNGEEGTQNIMGPRELPSSWSGDWRRTMLSRSRVVFTDESGGQSQIIRPMVLMRAFESLMRSGRRLRVTWAVVGDTEENTEKIVREGRAKTWRFPITRHTDVQWSVEFHWMSRGERKPSPISIRDDSFAANVIALNVQLGKMNAIIGGKLRAGFKVKLPSRLTLGQLESLANYPKNAANSLLKTGNRLTTTLGQLGKIANTVRSTPYAIANSAVDLARNSVAVCNQFTDQMSRLPPEAHSLDNNVRSLVRSSRHIYEVGDAVEAVARRALEMDEQFRRMVAQVALAGAPSRRTSSTATQARILALHVVKSGDTPERVSMKYYGNPDHSAEIMRANKLPWHQTTLPIGRPLVIPTIDQVTTQV